MKLTSAKDIVVCNTPRHHAGQYGCRWIPSRSACVSPALPLHLSHQRFSSARSRRHTTNRQSRALHGGGKLGAKAGRPAPLKRARKVKVGDPSTTMASTFYRGYVVDSSGMDGEEKRGFTQLYAGALRANSRTSTSQTVAIPHCLRTLLPFVVLPCPRPICPLRHDGQ